MDNRNRNRSTWIFVLAAVLLLLLLVLVGRGCRDEYGEGNVPPMISDTLDADTTKGPMRNGYDPGDRVDPADPADTAPPDTNVGVKDIDAVPIVTPGHPVTPGTPATGL